MKRLLVIIFLCLPLCGMTADIVCDGTAVVDASSVGGIPAANVVRNDAGNTYDAGTTQNFDDVDATTGAFDTISISGDATVASNLFMINVGIQSSNVSVDFGNIQLGLLNDGVFGSSMTNLSKGSFQSMVTDGDQHALTTADATSSILLGAGIASHKNSITIGDGNNSVADGGLVANHITAQGDLTASGVSVNNPPGFKVFLSGDQLFTNSVNTKVMWAVEQWDIGGGFNTIDSRFEPPFAGKYWFSFAPTMGSIDDGARILPSISLNGTVFIYSPEFHWGATGGASSPISCVLNLTTSDYVECFFFQAGSGVETMNSGTNVTSFTGFYIGE